MSATDGVIRRKLLASKSETQQGGPGADRSWRIALARAARDHLKLPLEVNALSLRVAGLAEVLELPPEQALLAVLEGPEEGLGVLAIAPEVLHAMGEALTFGRISPGTPSPRRPTRTDAAMIAPMMEAALADLDASLQQEADLIWAGGWHYASFIEDPRPLGLLLEDISYRVIHTEVDLGLGQRNGSILMAVPAEGRGRAPSQASNTVKDEANNRNVFAAQLENEVGRARSELDAVLARVTLPLSRVVGLELGELLPLSNSALDRVSIEGLDGRKLAEGKLGQNRGMRALRLSERQQSGRAFAMPFTEELPTALAKEPTLDLLKTG
jgi:flagellar motor switch protein FliM